MFSKEEQKRLYTLSKHILEQTNTPNALEASALVADLQTVIRYHEWRYYVQNEPVISDFEYDGLFKKLQALEAAYPNLQTADSPTVRVSNDITEEFRTVVHLIPMLSLENSYNAEDLNDFDEQVKKLAALDKDADVAYVVEPKFDGGSIALVYEDDVLVRAATRGNGAIGEEMTLNAKQMRSVPLRAAFSKYGIRKAELRGEALIRKDNFEKINKQRAEAGLQLFANPRNAATGGLRTKDPKETSARGLEAFLYQLGFAEDTEGGDFLKTMTTHHDSIEMLRELGFKVPTAETKLCKNIAEVIAYCNEWAERRDNYAYEIDGMVVKVNDLAVQNLCGYTSHHPRWAAAYKFKAKQATTKLLNVEFQVGKIGSVTPVAKLEPVALSGVTVSSVSLHNEDFIRQRDLRIGDTVLVERAGDVIPYIVKAMEDLRDGSEVPIVFPEFCPMNSNEKVPLVRVEGVSAWRCLDCTCGAQDYQRFVFHVSKHAMDIEGLSKATIERFMELDWLRTLPDFYRLDYVAISQLEGFGKKSADNLEKAIEKAKKNPIHRLLHSLSIHHLGKKAAQLLAAEVEHVMDLKDWDAEKLQTIPEIGPVLAENVVAFFGNEKNVAMLNELESLGVNLTATEEDKKLKKMADTEGGGILAGKTILFTGTLMNMTRENAEKLATEAGASIASGVSKNLSILVVGEKAGSKLAKAEKLGTVEILSEAAFLELVNTTTD